MKDGPIGREFYDRTDYFEGKGEHLQRLDGSFQRYRISKVLQIHRPGQGDRVLDLGCGWGTFSFALAQEVGEVVGIDFSEKSIEICRNRLEESRFDNLSFHCVDAGATGLEPDSFDAAIAADLFEHLYPDDTFRVIDESHRLLKSGGHLVVWTPHRGHLLEILKNNEILLKRDVSHVDYKSMERLTQALDGKGFWIEKSYYVESHLPVLRMVERLFQSHLPFLRRRIAILARKR